MRGARELSTIYFGWGERPDLMAQAWRLRHECLVEGRGWTLPSRRALEIDEYDAAALHCAVLRNGVVVGYARANRTDQPHLLHDHFAALLPPEERRRSALVWEISRFVLDRAYQPRGELLAELIDRAMDMGPRTGARELIAVVEPWMERAVARQGYAPRRIGQPVRVGDRGERALFAHVASVAVTEAPAFAHHAA